LPAHVLWLPPPRPYLPPAHAHALRLFPYTRRRPLLSPLFPYTTLFRPPCPRSTPPARPRASGARAPRTRGRSGVHHPIGPVPQIDRKSTRLNSSHVSISYAVFCLRKKRS